MAIEMGSRPRTQIGKELELVKHYVLLGIAQQILNHDIRIVGASQVKIPRLYESMLRGLQDRVLLELAAMRKQFRASGIHMQSETRHDSGLQASYRCGGYDHSFSMPWNFVRVESERLLKAYLAE